MLLILPEPGTYTDSVKETIAMTENFIMPQRVLGRTGERISVVGFGGIVAAKHTQAEAEALVNEAVVRGCNYFDVAPTYYDAEDRIGPALAPWRDKIFLSCKTACRDAKGARAELEQSLMKMQRLIQSSTRPVSGWQRRSGRMPVNCVPDVLRTGLIWL